MKCPAERAYSRRDCNISLVIIADIRDGESVLHRTPSDIMALNEDMTIHFVGLGGHYAWNCAEEIGLPKQKLIRVHLERYLDGRDDYILTGTDLKKQI